MNLNDLTVNFEHLDRKQILEGWEWLIGKSKIPIMLTACGNAFVQDENSLSVHYLDVTGGILEKVAESGEEFTSLLGNKDFIINHFDINLIGGMRQQNSHLEKGKVYSFKITPRLGGKFDFQNIEQTDILVHYSLNGQIAHQLKDVPEGTPINEIKHVLMIQENN